MLNSSASCVGTPNKTLEFVSEITLQQRSSHLGYLEDIVGNYPIKTKAQNYVVALSWAGRGVFWKPFMRYRNVVRIFCSEMIEVKNRSILRFCLSSIHPGLPIMHLIRMASVLRKSFILKLRAGRQLWSCEGLYGREKFYEVFAISCWPWAGGHSSCGRERLGMRGAQL